MKLKCCKITRLWWGSGSVQERENVISFKQIESNENKKKLQKNEIVFWFLNMSGRNHDWLNCYIQREVIV